MTVDTHTRTQEAVGSSQTQEMPNVELANTLKTAVTDSAEAKVLHTGNRRDWSSHLSDESKSRQPSPLKQAFVHIGIPGLISLGGGLPTPSLFPIFGMNVKFPSVGKWSESASTHAAETVIEKYKPKPPNTDSGHAIDLATTLQYGIGAGNPNFLDFITQHTQMVHNPPYDHWECIMTAGNTWALETCLRNLFNKGDSILMEEYTFSSAIETVRPLGIRIAGMAMDGDGVNAEALDSQLSNWTSSMGKKPKVMYTIPTGQNPTGSSMSLERRKAVYKVAQKHDLLIIEDEPYYFLQMPVWKPKAERTTETNGTTTTTSMMNNEEEQEKNGSIGKALIKQLIPSFLSMDVDGRVLRFDSFSKTIAPGTRCGWITGPSQIVERILRHTEVTTQAPAGFSQIILYNMIALDWGHEGFFLWLTYIRKVYTERRDNCLDAMYEFMPKEVVSWTNPLAGMFFWLEIDASKHPDYKGDILEIEMKMYEAGVANKVLAVPGSWFWCDSSRKTEKACMRGTFACVELEACREGIKRLAETIKKEFKLE